MELFLNLIGMTTELLSLTFGVKYLYRAHNLLLFDQYYLTLTHTDQQWYGMAKQGSTELELLHKFMFFVEKFKKIHILNYALRQKVH